jgi:hypothetical protein
VVEVQEKEQVSDGIDGPSIVTDPSVSLATLSGFASNKLSFGKMKCMAIFYPNLGPIHPLEGDKFCEW